jgi:Resolvase, N terminal domain
MATILYARVSTNKQTIEHQRTQAEQAGFRRPQGRRLFDLLRSGDALVVRWVDRLGRNYQDICDALREFTRRGVVIRTVINGITRSTARPRMLCNVPSVTRSSPSWRQLRRGTSGSNQGSSARWHRARESQLRCASLQGTQAQLQSRAVRECAGDVRQLAVDHRLPPPHRPAAPCTKGLPAANRLIVARIAGR